MANKKPKAKITLTIDDEIITKVQERQKEYGGKLSPLVENLLIGWLFKEEVLEKKWKELKSKIKEEDNHPR